jgi:hypothetical protein
LLSLRSVFFPLSVELYGSYDGRGLEVGCWSRPYEYLTFLVGRFSRSDLRISLRDGALAGSSLTPVTSSSMSIKCGISDQTYFIYSFVYILNKWVFDAKIRSAEI